MTQGLFSKNHLRKIVIIFLSISSNMCFGCSKEPSLGDGSFEYPKHMFWLRNKKNNFQLHTLIWGACHVTWLKVRCLYQLKFSKISCTVKPILSGHYKRRPKIGFQDRLSLNAGQKYCRMLQKGAFCNTFDLNLAIISLKDLCFVYF